MSDDAVNIEVNGQPLQARKGQMLIQATDAAGIYIPRFCYHDKLSVAANCRMCLVEVEKAPKPLPACATPVAEGMKAFTSSPRAIAAQKATMEFLLINHPLDCPICDQGGECELQDLAQGFGREVSRFAERKRVVKDKNLGPLISTDMTRCIHCTRCVRFTSEIAGLQELGTTGRGEDMQIGTFVEKGIDHELSGNVIDLCPVGALNSKPFRFQGRSWEMTEHALVSPHDAIGTNLHAHVLRGRLMRIVPRANEAINETWIADRDRFSYEGIYADDRLQRPLLKVDGELRVTDWESALTAAAQGLRDAVQRGGADSIGLLGSPTATTEELYLLARLARRLGTGNVDTRLRQLDFTDQAADACYPGLGMPLADVERLQALLVIGCHVRHEAPLLAHRIRKAAVRGTARVAFVNPAHLELHFPVLNQHVAPAGGLVTELATLVAAAAEKAGATVPADIGQAAGPVTAAHRATVAALAAEGERAILLGALASRHPAYADLRALAGALARLTGARLAYLPDGGNAAGAALAGALPHREAGGRPAARPGLDARAMLERPLGAYVLFGGIEPEADCLVPEAAQSIAAADFVVAITPFASAATLATADVLLPIGTFAETSGTFVNVEGRWQSFAGCVKPLGEARPGWKVLRVLGNLLALPGFGYASSEEIRDELAAATAGVAYDGAYAGCHQVRAPAAAQAADVPMYRLDAILRRAPALQSTRDGRLAAAAP